MSDGEGFFVILIGLVVLFAILKLSFDYTNLKEEQARAEEKHKRALERSRKILRDFEANKLKDLKVAEKKLDIDKKKNSQQAKLRTKVGHEVNKLNSLKDSEHRIESQIQNHEARVKEDAKKPFPEPSSIELKVTPSLPKATTFAPVDVVENEAALKPSINDVKKVAIQPEQKAKEIVEETLKDIHGVAPVQRVIEKAIETVAETSPSNAITIAEVKPAKSHKTKPTTVIKNTNYFSGYKDIEGKRSTINRFGFDVDFYHPTIDPTVMHLLDINQNVFRQLSCTVNADVDIVYSGFSGKTERKIYIATIEPSSNHIEAHCYLRGEKRTFNNARIISWRSTSLEPRFDNLLVALLDDYLSDGRHFLFDVEKARLSLKRQNLEHEEFLSRKIDSPFMFFYGENDDAQKIPETYLLATYKGIDDTKVECEITVSYFSVQRKCLLAEVLEKGHTIPRNCTLLFQNFINAVDAETGEYIENLEQFLLHKYAKTPEGIASVLWDKYSNSLTCILFVGRRKIFTDKKRTVFYKRIHLLFDDDGLGEHLHFALFSNRKITESMATFKKLFNLALKTEMKGREQLFAQCCYDILTAKKALEDDEQALEKYLLKKC